MISPLLELTYLEAYLKQLLPLHLMIPRGLYAFLKPLQTLSLSAQPMHSVQQTPPLL